MKQNNLHFLSETPCTIFISGQMVGDIDNATTFFIDIISYSESLIISVDPLSVNSCEFLPTTFKLICKDSKVYCASDNVTIVPYINNDYDILISLKKSNPSVPNLNVFNKKINNKNILVTNSHNSIISIFDNETELLSCGVNTLSDIKCIENDNVVCLTGNNNNGTFLLIYNLDNKTLILKDTFITVETDDKNIKALKPLNDFFKHGIVYNFNFESKKVESYTVYIKDSKVDVEDSLIPYAFLEAIKAADYVNGKLFLGKELSDTSNEKLKQYFNNIKSIYFNSYYFEPNQVNYTIFDSNKFRNFSFTIADNKIIEIDENEV